MVSKTRRRQLRRSNLENSTPRINETQIENVRTGDNDQTTGNVLSDIDINTMIREAVLKELNKHGVTSLTNRTNDGLTQSSSKTNNGDNVNNNRYRVTHEVAGNSKTDLNKSVRNDCPDSSVLARHNPIGSDTEMNLLFGNKYKNIKNFKCSMVKCGFHLLQQFSLGKSMIIPSLFVRTLQCCDCSYGILCLYW